MFSSIVLAFAFMFGNSVRTVYESIIYLFVVHPFDVGDKIIVDSVSSKVLLPLCMLMTPKSEVARLVCACWIIAALQKSVLSPSISVSIILRYHTVGTSPPNNASA